MKNYFDTLLMPKTNFEMKGDLKNKEPFFYSLWDKSNLHKEIFKKGNKLFVLHEGPPYANGDLHTGHFLNKVLKDFVNRSKAMQNYKLHYRHGWDTHGLPIELAIQKEKKDAFSLSTSDYINLCHIYANKQVEKQKEQMKRFQLLWPLNDAYLTLNKEYEYKQIKLFHFLLNKGLVYQSLKPVYWSWSIQSALAESEIEYNNKKSNSIYVTFKAKDSDYSALIWTTTPWTLFGNVAIALNKKIKYGIYKTKEYGNIILANDLAKTTFEKLGIEAYSKIKDIDPSIIEKEIFINPLNMKDSLGVISDHVNLDGGTGLVHIASGHGPDDFFVAKKYGLDVFSVLDEKGVLNEHGDSLKGTFYQKAEEEIINELKSKNSMPFHELIEHSYPHDWRTKKPLVFRATKQWFISIKEIEEDLLNEIKKVEWIPEWGEKRITNMIRDRQDWCISRQRRWGVPLPIIYKKDGGFIKDIDVQKNIEDLVKANGSRVWFEMELEKVLISKYNPKELSKEMDTMDVWFDSGVSHLQIFEEVKREADLYLEGNDQYRGWFNSSLITSYIYNKKSPYRSVLTHGFVVDKHGNKMSKSKNNIIDPLKLIDTYGAEILRLWVATSDYQREIKISDELVRQNLEQYKKIRNTFKFMLGNLFNYKWDKNLVDNLNEVDYFILNKLKTLNENANKHYNEYNFKKVISEVNNFIIIDLSSFYFNFSKDILYTHNKNSLRRRQIQSTLYIIIDTLMKIIAPILPTLAEDIYTNFDKDNKLISIHLEEFSDFKYKLKSITQNKWDYLYEIRGKFLKALEDMVVKKEVSKSLETELIVHLPKSKQSLFNQDEIKEYLMVASVDFKDKDELDVNVKKFNGIKCMRCWKHYKKEEMLSDDLCLNCDKFMKT